MHHQRHCGASRAVARTSVLFERPAPNNLLSLPFYHGLRVEFAAMNTKSNISHQVSNQKHESKFHYRAFVCTTVWATVKTGKVTQLLLHDIVLEHCVWCMVSFGCPRCLWYFDSTSLDVIFWDNSICWSCSHWFHTRHCQVIGFLPTECNEFLKFCFIWLFWYLHFKLIYFSLFSLWEFLFFAFFSVWRFFIPPGRVFCFICRQWGS